MKALVTGGGGFLGRALVRRLVERGDQVRILGRGNYPALTRLGVELFRGDVVELDLVKQAVHGVDVVFHLAAKAGVGGSFAEYVHSNILGTEAVLAACKSEGVQRLVYTSTPSVVFDRRGHQGADERAPRTHDRLSAYAFTKARAEESVLAANSSSLYSCALRPHLIWGPDDTQLVARLVARARAGRLALIGDGSGKVDSIYVDNAVDAELAAADALERGPARGNAYFLSNDEPLPVRDLMNRILGSAGLPPITRQVSPRLAYAVGALLELIYRALGLSAEPVMTRFIAVNLSTPHWFDITRAKADLGWSPRVSISEGLERLGPWIRASLLGAP
ncbi:MAG: NAD-dependent epimerase/dehydratase family protein [Myxococcota bacterium]